MVFSNMRAFALRRALTMAAVASFGAVLASADLSNVVFRVNATNSAGSGFVEVTADQGVWSVDPETQQPMFRWELTAPVVIQDSGSGADIALLNRASFTAISDPVIGMFFDVTAGATDTAFSFSSGTLSFPNFGSAVGQASAGLTLTDANNNGTAAITGTGGTSGLSAYSAQYNGPTQFAELLSGLSTSNPGGTTSTSAQSGPLAVGGNIFDMKTNYHFSLTAQDTASGTSVFVMVPEPAVGALLMLGGALLLRRRA